MEKNENGYPMNGSRNLSQNGTTGNGTNQNGRVLGQSYENGSRGSVQNGTQNRTQSGTQNGLNNGTNEHYISGPNRGGINNNYIGDRNWGSGYGGCSRLDENRGMRNTNGNMSGCGGNTMLDSFMPAYVYAPSQKFSMLLRPHDALSRGTLFEELYKPMEVYGRE